MDEYIRKEDALRVISDVLFETPPTGKEQIAVLKCSHSVRELPAAEVVPEIHGSWRSSDVPGSMLSTCSRCGFNTGAYSFRYCPHCGARMDAPSNLADLKTAERRRRIRVLLEKGVTDSDKT